MEIHQQLSPTLHYHEPQIPRPGRTREHQARETHRARGNSCSVILTDEWLSVPVEAPVLRGQIRRPGGEAGPAVDVDGLGQVLV